VLAKVASFGLTLGLTYLMVPVDYGLWALLFTVMTLLGLFFGAAFSSAAARWFFDHEADDFQRVVFTLGVAQLAFVGATTAVLVLWGAPAMVRAIDDIGSPSPLYLVITAGALSSLTAIPHAVYVARRQSVQAGWLGVGVALLPAIGMAVAALLDGALDTVLWGLVWGQLAVG